MNADAWIREIKNAGARYFAITTKYHDCFALWDTKVSDYNIMYTPFNRDILAKLVKSDTDSTILTGRTWNTRRSPSFLENETNVRRIRKTPANARSHAEHMGMER